MLGVHGNGLTHLIAMPPRPISTVIEIFYPGKHWMVVQRSTEYLNFSCRGIRERLPMDR